MINIGIIGFGGIVRAWHVPRIRESGEFFLKAAADVRPDDGTARRMDIPDYYDDYRKLLSDPEIDAVLVATPHDLHEPNCIEALEAGKHVLVEKPIARDLAESERILNAAERSGKVLMVGFLQRFYNGHQYIKGLIDGGTLGELLSARIDHYQNMNYPADSWWRQTARTGGGCVISCGVHRLDLLRWYFGESVEVYAKAVRMPERMEAEACAHAVITFDSGVIANFSVNCASWQYLYGESMSITGKEGTLRYVGGYSGVKDLRLALGSVDNGAMKQVEFTGGEEMYTHFANCIKEGKEPLTNGREGHETLRLVRAVYHSIEQGCVIDPAKVTV